MRLLKVIHYLCFAIILGLLGSLFGLVDQIYPDAPKYPDHAHITLYLDRNFDDFETMTIIEAAYEWSAATNHIIEYDIVILPTKEKLKRENAVYLVKRSPDDPQIILMDVTDENETLGVYEVKTLASIGIVSERLNHDNYKEIVLHELGHSLGIHHLEKLEDMDALMFPYASMTLKDGTVIPTGSPVITYKDLVAFCKLYRCNADKLKY